MISIREGSLLPHQEAGADLVSERGGTMLLADEMGVGKTRTAIAATSAAVKSLMDLISRSVQAVRISPHSAG